MQSNVFNQWIQIRVTQCVFFLWRKHPSKLNQYNECVLKRKNSEEQGCDSAVKQMKIKYYSTSCRKVTQSTVDRLVIEFVCESHYVQTNCEAENRGSSRKDKKNKHDC